MNLLVRSLAYGINEVRPSLNRSSSKVSRPVCMDRTTDACWNHFPFWKIIKPSDMDSNWQRQVDCMSANTICGQCSLWICAVWSESYTVRIIGIIKIIYLFYKTKTRQILHMYICFLYVIAICDFDVESEFYNLFNLLQPIYALNVVIVPSKVI